MKFRNPKLSTLATIFIFASVVYLTIRPAGSPQPQNKATENPSCQIGRPLRTVGGAVRF